MKNQTPIVLAASCAIAIAGLTVNSHAEPAAASTEHVPVELVLLVDTSGSVDSAEYDLQRMGYADAFRDHEVARMFEEIGGVAVTYIEWSDTDHHSVRIPWRRLDTVEDCADFASAIGQVSRDNSGETMLAPALEFALEQIETNAYTSFKRVIDVSGDGRCENWEFHTSGKLTDGETDPAFYGTPWDDVVASMSGRVDQVNGICIGTNSDLIAFYTDVLPQGPGSFMRQVNDFVQFAEGIKEKLMREVSVVPGMYD